VPTGKSADLSLFLDILKTLERINAPYMIIGAFAGTFYYTMVKIFYWLLATVFLDFEGIET